MADDFEGREFSKDNPPEPNEGSWYRSREFVYACGPFADVKVNGKRHKGQGFLVDDAPLEDKQGKLKWVDADEFNAQYGPVPVSDIPRIPGGSFDVHEVSKEQATGYQMDSTAEGDDEAGAILQDQNQP